jgi:UDP-N-acetylmuramoylalanine--D-glutamate ligase
MSPETTMPELAARMPDLTGIRVLVVGLGRSGVAAARLASRHGARVIATDTRDESDLGSTAAELRSLGAELHAGGHPESLVDAAELVVLSPGVDPRIRLVAEARRRGRPLWGEVELAARFCRGRIIGITGSNGKSTVTAMTGRILRGAGVAGGTGGNLATPFSDLLSDDAPDAVHAVELSSFQLETVDCLRPDVAVVLNLSRDHMDRYASVEEYAAAKARLLDVQSPGAAALLNADDAASAGFHAHLRGRLHLFSTRQEPDRGAFLRGGRLVLRTEAGEDDLLGAAELPLAGEHNLSNALAAALACRLVDCAAAEIAEGLRSFEALPHRLQHVRTIAGVGFYNDSKATNPASAARALSSFGPRRVHLILGGRDKDADWSELEPCVARHARRVLLVGESAPALEDRMARVAPVEICGTVERAVTVGFDGAAPGDVVLLSPACASFDQYRNFEERGEDFRRAVEALGGGDDDAE